MKRTTIFITDDLLYEVKSYAQEHDMSMAETVREALELFIHQQKRGKPKLSFMGIGNSGQSDIAENHEKLLWQEPHN